MSRFSRAFTAYQASPRRTRAARFEALIDIPAGSVSGVVSKLSAIVGQFGNGRAPTRVIEAAMFDLMATEYAR